MEIGTVVEGVALAEDGERSQIPVAGDKVMQVGLGFAAFVRELDGVWNGPASFVVNSNPYSRRAVVDPGQVFLVAGNDEFDFGFRNWHGEKFPVSALNFPVY